MVHRREPVVLNVAEKPSVARALAQVFSRMNGSIDRGMTRANGNIQIMRADNVAFPDIYCQGNGATINGALDAPHVMMTTSVRGHLLSRDFGQQYGWSNCAPSALFTAPIETHISSDMEPIKNMLEAEARKADVLVLWLDCDREGEAIAAEVREVCVSANPRLAQPFGPQCPTKVFRAKFSTVLPNEIQRALRSLGRINESYVGAVETRSEIDLRVGAAFTRFQTLRLQKKFDGLQDGVISYGPCQFPTLGFVVERWARITTFIPHEFWYIELKLNLFDDEDVGAENIPPSDYNNSSHNIHNRPPQQRSRTIEFSWKRGRLYDRLLTFVLYDSCLDAGEAIVTSLTGRPKSRWRPIPLATVELQKRASKFLRLGSENLMTAAEELYQQGLISYPRTETERFQPEFQHLQLIESFQDLGQGHELADYASKLLTGNNFQTPKAGPNDDKAHPPITPCRAVDPSTIGDPIQRSVYLLVVKHYLACCSRDALGRETGKFFMRYNLLF
jgi:DNA topoisomerase-3